VQAFKSNKNESNIEYEARLIWNKFLAPSADAKIFNVLNIPKTIVYLLQSMPRFSIALLPLSYCSRLEVEIAINNGNVQKSIFDPIIDFIQQSLTSKCMEPTLYSSSLFFTCFYSRAESAGDGSDDETMIYLRSSSPAKTHNQVPFPFCSALLFNSFPAELSFRSNAFK
jgi:hypothetical protein